MPSDDQSAATPRDRDRERMREFADRQQELETCIDELEDAISALKGAESAAPVSLKNELNGLRIQVGKVKEKAHHKIPATVMKQAGAKHQKKTENQDQFENRGYNG